MKKLFTAGEIGRLLLITAVSNKRNTLIFPSFSLFSAVLNAEHKWREWNTAGKQQQNLTMLEELCIEYKIRRKMF